MSFLCTGPAPKILPGRWGVLFWLGVLNWCDREPINDPELLPRLEPRPENPVMFLHGLLESIARIECRGHQMLQALSAAPVRQLFSAGAGSKNTTWTAIRGGLLQVPMVQAVSTDAAYGSAVLARGGEVVRSRTYP